MFTRIWNIRPGYWLYTLLGTGAAIFVLAYYWPAFYPAMQWLLLVALVAILADGLIVALLPENGLQASRHLPERFSNGDDNTITLSLRHHYPYSPDILVYDELPMQFQMRHFRIRLQAQKPEPCTLTYTVHPISRGVYEFGKVVVLLRGPLGFFWRRLKKAEPAQVKTYPSFLQMRRYELLAASNQLTRAGIKRIRQISHRHEFDQIRPYVKGDEFRLINWKATARKKELMVNQYQAERSQEVYNLIDMGRSMKMPFAGMTLLDYAINTSLVIANTAMHRHDKAGLLTFSHQPGPFIAARRSRRQLQMLLEQLYHLQTHFLEPDYEQVYTQIKRHIKQRSLLLLYTNFESRNAMQRNLPFLRAVARQHLLVVIFFENTELADITNQPAGQLMQVYEKTMAQQLMQEKRQIARELNQHGIHAVLSAPEQLHVNTLNKYLELKARGLI